MAKTRHELISELADFYEVIDSLCILHAIDRDEILRAQNAKSNARGSFSERKYVETAEHPVGSTMEQYCLNAPDKYPEIIIEKDIL